MHVRLATEADLPDVLRLLFQDRATTSHELAPDAPCYRAAFRQMQASPENATWVAEEAGRVVGTFQLTFIRHLMRRGSLVPAHGAGRAPGAPPPPRPREAR